MHRRHLAGWTWRQSDQWVYSLHTRPDNGAGSFLSLSFCTTNSSLLSRARIHGRWTAASGVAKCWLTVIVVSVKVWDHGHRRVIRPRTWVSRVHFVLLSVSLRWPGCCLQVNWCHCWARWPVFFFQTFIWFLFFLCIYWTTLYLENFEIGVISLRLTFLCKFFFCRIRLALV